MTKDCHMVWDSCLRIIKKSVPPQSYKTWFEPIRPVHLNNSELTIQVPNKFFYEWLEEHYVQLLKTSIRQELGERGRLLYHIMEGTQNGANRTTEPTHAQPSADKDNEPVPGVFDAEMIKNPFVIPGIRRIKIDPQINPNYQFDNFIEGDCNRLARNAGMAVAKKPGGTAFNPLVIFGDVGLGKTHLAHAIGNEVANRNADKMVLYVSAEKFTNQIIQAIKNNAVNDFVNFYQMIDVLILDDIQFLSGKQKTQEIFFHIFNQLHQNGKQIILTSDRPPKDLEGIQDRLISRFKWGLSADLQAPDLETRMAILGAKMEVEGVDIPNDVLEFICYNIKNNIRELEGVMISLMAQSTLIRRDVDIELAKEVIRNFVTTINKEITVEFIQELVAEHFNVPVERLHQETRKRNIVIARQLSMFLAKKLTNKSLKAIGETFGGRDHSTVIYSCKAVQDMMDTDMIFMDTVSELEKKIKMSLNH
ncbi:MAG: chromosomal replication initiator protein DnaA [Lewinellaceae bacterium]|nr:chromosomal replication initiator protein DnaA [Saprospiraceae bacterium]MCB9316196.1 chromosomal replication initiator protein DnaA [Lewinellaceae bacterium]MCB9329618.1 chromosomal replication initiator protein DnaA [Lewinellaceae bacterium]